MFSGKTGAYFGLCVGLALAIGGVANPVAARAQQPAPRAQPLKQVVGTVKSITGSTIVLTLDGGAEVSIAVPDGVRIVRVAPGQTDLKAAPAIAMTDIVVGDRILVRGNGSSDGKSLTATAVMAMKKSDVQAKQDQEREDWQKRGIGGLVSAVDAGAGTVTITVVSAGGNKPVSVQVAKATVLRRYAPDSVQFDDAVASTIDQIKPGDQLRARGTRSADGNDFAAEEIVSGVFRNISGTIKTLDAAGGTMTVNDLATKKPIVVKVSAQSQVVKLPAAVAQGLAARMKGGAAGGSGGAAAGEGAPGDGSARPGAAGGGNGRAGQADLQQVVSRTPPAKLSDLQQGDAVMIVSTEGTNAGVTAITLLAGVEPILQASPSGAAPSLSPWNIGGAPDAGDAGP